MVDPSPAHAPPTVRIQLLGGFQVTIGERVLAADLWRRKAAHLVKLLALAPGNALSRDQVLEALWAEAEPESAANSFHQTLHIARTVLAGENKQPTPLLRLRDGMLNLCPDAPLWIDSEAFQTTAKEARLRPDRATYQAALSLYTGELLPEDRYADWTQGPRDRLRTIYLDLLLNYAQFLETGHESAFAIEALGQLLAADPLHEEAHAHLIRLYALNGQRLQAVRQYQSLVEILHRELEVEPSRETRRLYQAVVEGRFPATPAPAAPVQSPTSKQEPQSSNLPTQLTSFIGRTRELTEFAQLLAKTRLLTLTGPGGCGKTRLMLELASRERDTYTGGAWLVDLASLSDPRLLPQAVATALNVREAAGRPLSESLIEALLPRQMLLLLDNCEHLIEACAQLAHALLQACPRLKILATSREPLHIHGELTVLTPSLTLPDPQNLPPVEQLAQYEAVQLLVERATAVLPSFALKPENAATVAQICYRLDGIPLALELAATRVRALSVEQIAARLDQCFQILRGGHRSALTRQQTLRATLDWSYDLLASSEQRLFRQLAVFAGGFTLEAVEAVCPGEQSGDGETLELFTQLVDKSLVVVEPVQGAERYRLLETVRQYASEKLRNTAEEEPVRVRHLEWYVALMEQFTLALRSGMQKEWFERIELEHENMRAALRMAQESDPAAGIQLAGALAPFWFTRGYTQEGHLWLESLLEQAERTEVEIQPAIHGRAIGGAGSLAMFRSDYPRARVLFEQCVALQRRIGNEIGLHSALNNLALVVHAQGDYERAYDLHEESLAIARKLGNTWAVARSLLNQGITLRNLGKVEQAKAHLEESLALGRKLGEKSSVANILGALGEITLEQGDIEEAKKQFEEALLLLQEIGSQVNLTNFLRNLGQVAQRQGDTEQASRLYAETLTRSWKAHEQLGIARTLEEWGSLAISLEQAERATHLRGAAAALRVALGTPIRAYDRGRLERELETMRQTLGEEVFARVWAEGQSMSADQAVEYALARTQ